MCVLGNTSQIRVGKNITLGLQTGKLVGQIWSVWVQKTTTKRKKKSPHSNILNCFLYWNWCVLIFPHFGAAIVELLWHTSKSMDSLWTLAFIIMNIFPTRSGGKHHYIMKFRTLPFLCTWIIRCNSNTIINTLSSSSLHFLAFHHLYCLSLGVPYVLVVHY